MNTLRSPQVSADFERRQERLAERFGDRSVFAVDSGTMVVVPSITFPSEELRKIVGIAHYEERMLFLLLLLAAPDLRMLYLSSCPVDDEVVDYYLSFLPDPEGARSRLKMAALGDPLPRPLSSKLLEAPGAIEEIRSRIEPAEEAFMVTFNATSLEADLAELLRIPIYGAHPALWQLGTKSSARRIAKKAGVPVLEGTEDIFSLADMEEAIQEIGVRKPDAEAVVMKLNNGFSGQGNAIVEFGQGISPLQRSATTFCAAEESWPSYRRKIEEEGAIVEELVRPAPFSPSVQVDIAASGKWRITSTHDQILGGPDDQVYLGCRFPASSEYRADIARQADLVAEVLASEGVIGPFGIDFVVLEESAGNRSYLSEINLRMGGTTHPFHMARLVSGGTYDRDEGHLVAADKPRFYVSTDNLKSERYEGVTPSDVIGRVREAGLAFDRDTATGTTLHLLGAMDRFGKLGVTCIAESREAAQELFEHSVAEIDELSSDR